MAKLRVSASLPDNRPATKPATPGLPLTRQRQTPSLPGATKKIRPAHHHPRHRHATGPS
jgi:hypothetical protein